MSTPFLIFANEPIKHTMKIDVVDCHDGHGSCVKLVFKNKSNKSICLGGEYFDFSYKGLIFDLSFDVFDLKADKEMIFTGPQLHELPNDRLGTSLWWVPENKFLYNVSAFSRFYALEDGKSYLITYKAVAYYCENYEDREGYLLIEGKKEFTYKKNGSFQE